MLEIILSDQRDDNLVNDNILYLVKHKVWLVLTENETTQYRFWTWN